MGNQLSLDIKAGIKCRTCFEPMDGEPQGFSEVCDDCRTEELASAARRKPHKCRVCGKGFASSHGAKMHENMKHNAKRH